MKRKNIFITVAYESVLNKIKKTLSKIMVWFVWENREEKKKCANTGYGAHAVSDAGIKPATCKQ